MHLRSVGSKAELDRYIGYWKPYAASHVELDQDQALQQEVANAARTLMEGALTARTGRLDEPGRDLSDHGKIM